MKDAVRHAQTPQAGLDLLNSLDPDMSLSAATFAAVNDNALQAAVRAIALATTACVPWHRT